MIPSRRADLVWALSIQFLLAGAAVLATWNVLGTFGSVFFVRYSSVCAVFMIINYFDFGAIGIARRIGADPGASFLEREGQFLSCIGTILRRSAVVSVVAAVVLAALFLTGITSFGGISYLRSLVAAAAVSPLFICLGALRGYLEGCGKMWRASLLRGGNGLVIAASPLIAALLPWGVELFFWIPPLAVAAVLAGAYLRSRSNGAIAIGVPVDYASVGRTELTYTIAGVVFLYLDRYVIGWFGRSSEGGNYLFALDMVARSSLLYVPLVLNQFPRMVALSGGSVRDAWGLVLGSAKTSSVAVGSLLLVACSVGWSVREHLPARVSEGTFWWAFSFISAAYAIQASNFAFQKFLGVNLRTVTGLVRSYAGIVVVYSLAVVLVVWKIGVMGLPLAFLGRSALEYVLLRLASRGLAREEAKA